MGIYEYLPEFGGQRIAAYQTGQPLAAGVGYRISVTYAEYEAAEKLARAQQPPPAQPGLLSRLFGAPKPPAQPPAPRVDVWAGKFAELLARPEARQLETLVVGHWQPDGGSESGELLKQLLAARDRLPNLKALFLADVLQEECEISWIQHDDPAPLLEAFPHLTAFGCRGGIDTWTPVRHENVRRLQIETGGLPAAVARGVMASYLPALEHLELWLGDEGYGSTVTVADLEPLLSGRLYPRLRVLALSDSYFQDDVAVAVARSPLAERIKVLDLSKGTLSDKGANALLESPALRRLESLDLHHHYLSAEMEEEMRAVFGERVNLADRQDGEDEEDRYVAVSE
ncbi:MAG: STM4015 family protein [Bryobacterales bacterium]|nr:STM4015 family protein [Bryobacterales bacterium]